MLKGGGMGMKNDGGWGGNGNALLLVVVVVLVVVVASEMFNKLSESIFLFSSVLKWHYCPELYINENGKINQCFYLIEKFKPNHQITIFFHSLTQCPRTDLSKRFLPKQMTTTG